MQNIDNERENSVLVTTFQPSFSFHRFSNDLVTELPPFQLPFLPVSYVATLRRNKQYPAVFQSDMSFMPFCFLLPYFGIEGGKLRHLMK